jgi:hypothetical protein
MNKESSEPEAAGIVSLLLLTAPLVFNMVSREGVEPSTR